MKYFSKAYNENSETEKYLSNPSSPQAGDNTFNSFSSFFWFHFHIYRPRGYSVVSCFGLFTFYRLTLILDTIIF